MGNVHATLADIRSKPETPNRARAAANIEGCIRKLEIALAHSKPGGKPVRSMVIADREQLMRVIDTPALPDGFKARAKAILGGSGTRTDRDVEFLKQTS